MDLVLHIGTEKTGTTLIQKTLYRNRAALHLHGVALSSVLGAPNNRLLPARVQTRLDDFHQRLGVTTLAERDRYFASFDDQFGAELAKLRDAGTKRLIISSEHLSSRLSNRLDLQRLHEVLRGQFSNITVLCYVREQTALNRSLYSTAVLNGYDVSAQEFARQIQVGNVYYNFERMLDLWAEEFGQDAVQLAIYDRRAFAGGDLLSDFFRRVVPGLDVSALDTRVLRRNRGVTAGQAHVMRRINRLGLPNTLRRLLVEGVRYLPFADSPLDPELKRRVHSAFDESNRAMARRFLKNEGNPFAP